MNKNNFDAQGLFNKAVLLEMCRKSPILRNIEYDANTVTEAELRELVNYHNCMQMKHFPILLIKLLVKYGLVIAVDKIPSIKKYINPDNLAIRLESDELACLDTKPTKTNVYIVVAKNIVCSLLGVSIDNIEECINNIMTRSKDSNNAKELNITSKLKIPIDESHVPSPVLQPPVVFTDIATDKFTTPKSQTLNNENRNTRDKTHVPLTVNNLKEFNVNNNSQTITNAKRTNADGSSQSSSKRLRHIDASVVSVPHSYVSVNNATSKTITDDLQNNIQNIEYFAPVSNVTIDEIGNDTINEFITTDGKNNNKQYS